MEEKKRVSDFEGLNKFQKKKLKNAYFKREWKNLLISYFFIILSSSRPMLSSNNGAIYVLAWFTLSILLSLHAYVNQSDYMSSRKRAEKYSKRHKSSKVEKGRTFIPEIGGWTFIRMQVSAACLVYLIALPISFYLQFKDFEVYKDDYVGIFIGVFADTYIIAFLNGILKLFVEFIFDCSNGITTIKKSILSLKIEYFLSIVILCGAFYYYFNKEFEGLFGDMRKIIGGIYLVFILCPVIKAIKQVIINKKQRC